GGPGKEGRDVHLLPACESHPVCSVCLKPCDVSVDELGMCEKYCEKIEPVCIQSCRFLASAYSWKGGACPDPKSARGFDAACVKTCSLDGDCPENQKCCFNGCGHTCMQPVYNNSRGLPPKPYNISFEERQEGRALLVTWNSDYKGLEAGLRGQFIYLLEQRNTTTPKPNWDEPPRWQFVTQTQQTGVLLRRIHAGHWYQFRVIAVNSNGTQGFSPLSTPFKSSRDVKPPQAPRNLTEGVTTLKNGRVDVTVHWEPPNFSDLPIWRYMIFWSERLSSASPILMRLDVLQKALPGNQHEFKLKSLKPGTTYFVEMEAVVQKSNSKGSFLTRLRSPKTNLTFTTYSPPDAQIKDKEFGHLPIQLAIVKIKNLRAGNPYFDKGVLKAHISWQIIKDYRKMVKNFLIYWRPESCAQNYQSSSNRSATSYDMHFKLYDLLYECDYDVKVQAVTHTGLTGKATSIILRTPLCGDIAVIGGSLPPQCPERVINPPRAIPAIAPFTSNINCNIEVRLTWKPPQSDLPIQQYHLKWWLSEKVQVIGTNSDQHLYRREAIEITLPNVSTEYIIRGLNNSGHYMIELYAVSAAGLGKSVFTEIWTPAVIPCKPDKEPEPPDKVKLTSEQTTKAAIFPSSNMTASSSPPLLPPSSSKNIVPVDRTLKTTSTSVITLATKLPPPTPPGKPSQNNPPKIPDIYSIVYYLFFFISEWLKKHFS
ncbi:hypothetical protein CHS0354_027131, partial [Potamilus streckersoni]